MKKTIRLRSDPYTVLTDVLSSAIEAGMNKHDKYCTTGRSETGLSEASRALLLTHIQNYFWVELEERGVEVK